MPASFLLAWLGELMVTFISFMPGKDEQGRTEPLKTLTLRADTQPVWTWSVAQNQVRLPWTAWPWAEHTGCTQSFLRRFPRRVDAVVGFERIDRLPVVTLASGATKGLGAAAGLGDAALAGPVEASPTSTAQASAAARVATVEWWSSGGPSGRRRPGGPTCQG